MKRGNEVSHSSFSCLCFVSSHERVEREGEGEDVRELNQRLRRFGE